MSEQDDRVIAGRYRVTAKLGSGAMGAVWVATDERLHRTVALKEILLPVSLNEVESERARQRAMREGRIAARVRHANAIAVYDVVDEGGNPVLIMEYLPSRSLAEVLHERGALPPRDVARIGAQVAAALAEAHSVGIVHRDVKPANILLGENGDIKLTDFGISRADDDVTVTATGLLSGTPAYLSPEAARGGDPDPASDVFSLGATLYRAVEGTPPFGGNSDNAIAVLHAVASGKIDPPRRAGELTNALTLMMRIDPATRPTMPQVSRELAAVAAGQVGAAATVPAPEAPTRAITAATLPRVGTRTDLSPVGYAEDEPVQAEERRKRPAYLAMAMAALAVAAVVAVLLLVQDKFGPGGANPPAAPSTSAPASLSAAELERAVSEYYALLPEDTDAGWERLGPDLRAQGKEKYERYWGTVEDVEVLEDPRADGDTVVVTIELDVQDKGTFREVHELGMVTSDGTALINSDRVVSSERVGGEQSPAPPPTHEHTPEATTQPSTHTTEPTHEPTTSQQTETSAPTESPTEQPTEEPPPTEAQPTG